MSLCLEGTLTLEGPRGAVATLTGEGPVATIEIRSGESHGDSANSHAAAKVSVAPNSCSLSEHVLQEFFDGTGI